MDRVEQIHLQGGYKKECFLIHGYTGCLNDFNELPHYLHQQLKVDVKLILLKGHGTKVQDLDDLELTDFLAQIEGEFKRDFLHYRKMSVGGLSFGAQMALYLAAHYPVERVVAVGMPYQFKFPLNLPGLDALGLFKKTWKKSLVGKAEDLKGKNPFYLQSHIKGVKIIKEANKLIMPYLRQIHCPLLSINVLDDPVVNLSGLQQLEKHMGYTHEKKFFKERYHNVFFTNSRFDVYKCIKKFMQKQPKKNSKKAKVAAIVPVYNEAHTVSNVLKTLLKSDVLDEIIVVDDGSNDHTAEEVKKFERVKLLQNGINHGKAYSMQRGVENTGAEILFFCDADLKGLTPKIVKEIITPVLEGGHDMFIAFRNHLAEKMINSLSLLSGERAVTRALWNKVPDGFKSKYRIELGLNFTAQHRGKGFGWQRFNYHHVRKEKKYGFWKGFAKRMEENIDIAYAYGLTLWEKGKNG